ncbi:uncharacterized protein NEMAJ01_0581 [Nematocida major]|uniref:uncharacterized protein n=1 Tax=Nematocida major TaxID=1912982 RepID=UPI002007C6D8|nr:uncharacterized protein NEMAJ01_0581 [Nematocida major]KAH9385685.1 hypothetical protein NEMAJ01_0581 [Nematocida major]
MKLQHMIQSYADMSVGLIKHRWAVFLFFLVLFVWRVIYTEGYRLVAYCLFLYFLHCFIGFCTPIDSEIPDPFDIEEEESAAAMPIRKSGDESKPFIRRLPEFELWAQSVKACIMGFFMTFMPVFNIPVFTPILVVYFGGLVYLTLIKIRKHMEKYKYNPFFNAKKIYKGIVELK